jgi:cytochrome c553
MKALAVLCTLIATTPVLAQEAELARARKIVAGSCFLCHGMQGESATELFPRLAAQNAEYIAKQLANFKSGERKSEIMPRMVGALTPEDMRRQLYQPPDEPAAPPTDARLAAQGMVIYRRAGRRPKWRPAPAATASAATARSSCRGWRGRWRPTWRRRSAISVRACAATTTP